MFKKNIGGESGRKSGEGFC